MNHDYDYFSDNSGGRNLRGYSGWRFKDNQTHDHGRDQGKE